jgi:hypothetical protein
MAGLSTTKRPLQADILTSSYRIVGELQVGSLGFNGLLNDEASPLLEIFHAGMARAHLPSKLVDHYDVLRVVKNQVIAVGLKRREDVGPHLPPGSSTASKAEISVCLTTSVYEIQGTIEWAGHFDFSSIMAGGHDFFPLFDASATMVLVTATRFECPAMFFNRRYINTLALSKQR